MANQGLHRLPADADTGQQQAVSRSAVLRARFRQGAASPRALPELNPIREIAVFRALQLGDLLCAIPALRAIRRAHPDARITLIGLPWARDFVRRMPFLDAFLEFPGFPGLPERVPDISSMPAFFEQTHQRRFDLAIQLHGDGGITNRLVGMLGAKRTAGFFAADRSCPNPERFLPWPAHLPEIRRLLALTAHLGFPDCGEHLEFPVFPEELQELQALRAAFAFGEEPYVCIHPGARLASRRWLPERFAQVADRLTETGLSVVLTGSEAEMLLLADVESHMHHRPINLGGKTSLGTLAALVEQAALVVCNDTGMSHVAAATGTPSVVICSGADPMRWRPLDHGLHRMLWTPVACRPCAHHHCPTGHECAIGVEIDRVLAEALSLLKHMSPAASAGRALTQEHCHVAN